MLQHSQLAVPPQPQPQILFDFVQSETQAMNYLVSPGYTVFLLDQTNGVLYQKMYQSMEVFDLIKREQQTNQNGSGNALTEERVAQMIEAALSRYNPHIPKKDRRND